MTRHRVSITLLFATAAVPLLFFSQRQVIQATTNQDKYKVVVLKETAPEDFSEAIRESLELTGFRMTDSKNQVVCDLWLRKELPVNPKFRPTLDTNYGFARSQLIGAMRVPENGTKDLRDQKLKAGSYTLRYAQQPMDGNHIGSWPYLDFAVTLSAQQDKKPENRGEQEVVDASMSGRVHPAIFSLMPPEKRKTLPTVVHQSSGNLWILALPAEIKSGDKIQKSQIELVIIGEAEI